MKKLTKIEKIVMECSGKGRFEHADCNKCAFRSCNPINFSDKLQSAKAKLEEVNTND